MPSDTTVDILIVDDRDDGLVAIEALLHDRKNYNLVKANSGSKAIAELRNYDFAMILLDVQMPELDGFQTAEIIRSNKKFERIPIIFVTAINKDDRYVYRGYQAGAVGYVFKPFDPIILRSKVAVFADLHLHKRRLKEQAIQLARRDQLEHQAIVQSVELENLRRYRNLADSIPHIVMRCTLTREMEYHNELWRTFTGMGAAESTGLGWQDAIHSHDKPALLEVWALAGGKSFEAECRIRRYDGKFRWHWLKAEAECDSKGNVVGWLASCTDIEDRKIAEQNFKAAQENAEAASSAKSHFLANMSHEIRTPLNAIMGFTELLLDAEITPDEKIKNISIVRRNGHQLLKIVDEILDISKVEAGGLEIERVEAHIPELLNEVYVLMENEAAKKSIQLGFSVSSCVPHAVITDSNRLRQILLNVVGNAIKFTETGSVKLMASFRTDNAANSWLSFEVEDTGLGIDPEHYEKIFHPFSQADSSTTRLYGGTGLGLPLSRKLARALGGDVRLRRTKANVGSVFEVELKVELPARELINENKSEVTAKLTQQSGLEGKRLLLVEDAEDNQYLIKQFLSPTGLLVDVASNGREGVKKALANNYDVVLMDIQMPIVDGYQATKDLRCAGYDRPIIALTAHALVEEREKTFRSGCSDHLTKPIVRKALIESIVRALRDHGFRQPESVLS